MASPTVQKTLAQIETLLTEAERSKSWGVIEVDLKLGKPTLIRSTKQIKLDEETPANADFRR